MDSDTEQECRMKTRPSKTFGAVERRIITCTWDVEARIASTVPIRKKNNLDMVYTVYLQSGWNLWEKELALLYHSWQDVRQGICFQVGMLDGLMSNATMRELNKNPHPPQHSPALNRDETALGHGFPMPCETWGCFWGLSGNISCNEQLLSELLVWITFIRDCCYVRI